MKRHLHTSAFVLLLCSMLIASGCTATGNALINSELAPSSQQSSAAEYSEPESRQESSISESGASSGPESSAEESKASKNQKNNNKPAAESSDSGKESSAESSEEQRSVIIKESSSEEISEPESSIVLPQVSAQSEETASQPVQVSETHESPLPESQPETSAVSRTESPAPSKVSKPESSAPSKVSKPESSAPSKVSKPESSAEASVSKPSVSQTSTNNVDKLYGKKLGAVGDSVVYGHKETGFAGLIAQDHNMKLQNLAVNGATIARDIPYRGNPDKNRICIPDRAQKLDKDCDFIVTDGGYNDFVNGVPLGELTKKGEAPDPYTFYGGLERLCRTLISKKPKDGILFVITHKVKHADNALGLSFEDYRYAILQVCGKYDIQVLDLYAGELTMLYFEHNKTAGEYTQLGQGNIHPTELGYRKYYLPRIEERLELMIKE